MGERMLLEAVAEGLDGKVIRVEDAVAAREIRRRVPDQLPYQQPWVVCVPTLCLAASPTR